MKFPAGVTVLWNDAHLNGTDEADVQDIVHRPWKYATKGWLVKSDSEGVTVGQDVGEDGKFRTRTFIPRVLVVWEVMDRFRAPRKPKPDVVQG